jgi:hypothetical protein
MGPRNAPAPLALSARALSAAAARRRHRQRRARGGFEDRSQLPAHLTGRLACCYGPLPAPRAPAGQQKVECDCR